MRADRITLAVTAAEAAECAGLGLRLMYMAYRLSPSGVLLKSNALGAVQGGVMAVMGSAPQLADTGAIAGAVTAECGAHGFEGVYLDFDERTAAAERLIEALSPRLAERGARPVSYTHPDVYKRQLSNCPTFYLLRSANKIISPAFLYHVQRRNQQTIQTTLSQSSSNGLNDLAKPV